MHILHVISGLNGGGAETVLHRLCTSSAQRKSDIVVSLSTDGAYGERLRQAGLEVHSLGMRRRFPELAGPLKLRRLIRVARPDLVQTWLYHGDLVGGVAARLCGVPVIWGLHNFLIDSTTRRSTRLVANACAVLSTTVPAAIISCSRKAADTHIRRGFAAGKFRIIPNGYDTDLFRPKPTDGAAFRRDLGLGQDEQVIGTVARLDPQKDHRNLLDALALLVRNRASVRCLLVGQGIDDRDGEITRLIKDRGLQDQVRMLGARDDIQAVMNAIDIHVLPSYGEAFPNVVAEAMACGTPCVVTDVGEATRIVGDTGWVVPPRDSQALAAAVAAALGEHRDPARWARRQAKARERIVENYALPAMVDAYETVWRQVIEAAE